MTSRRPRLKPLLAIGRNVCAALPHHDSPVSKHFCRRSQGKRIHAALTGLGVMSPAASRTRGLAVRMTELRVGPAQHLITLVERVTPNQRTSACDIGNIASGPLGSKTSAKARP